MDINTISNYAILFTGALLLIVVVYLLLKAFVGGIVLLVKATFRMLKLVFKTLYFLLIIALIAGGIQLVLIAIRSFPDHALYSAAWAGVGAFSAAAGSLGLALRIREHRKRLSEEPASQNSPDEDPSSPPSLRASDPEIKKREYDELSWKQRAEEAEVERQFQLMKAQQGEREQAYQNWIAEQEKKDKWKQAQAEIDEFNRQSRDRHHRDDG